MHDLLTTHEAAHASRQGWQLSWVVDATTSKVTADILPTWTPASNNNVTKTTRLVWNLAKSGDVVAQRALQMCVQSRQPQPKPKRKKQ